MGWKRCNLYRSWTPYPATQTISPISVQGKGLTKLDTWDRNREDQTDPKIHQICDAILFQTILNYDVLLLVIAKKNSASPKKKKKKKNLTPPKKKKKKKKK